MGLGNQGFARLEMSVQWLVVLHLRTSLHCLTQPENGLIRLNTHNRLIDFNWPAHSNSHGLTVTV